MLMSDIKDNIDKRVVLTSLAVKELCYLRKAHEVAVYYMKDNFTFLKTKKEVLFKPADINVYVKLLQLTGVLKYRPVNAFDLGNELGYASVSERGKKDCSSVSKSLSRLKRAGYIVSLQTCRSNIIFPLVRSFADKKGGESVEYNPASGFKKFLDDEEQKDLFQSLKFEESYTDKFGNHNFVARKFSKDAEISFKNPDQWILKGSQKDKPADSGFQYKYEPPAENLPKRKKKLTISDLYKDE